MFEKTLLDAQKHRRAKPMAIAVSFEIFIIALLVFSPLFFKTNDPKEFILVEQLFLSPKAPPGPKIDSGAQKSSAAAKKKVEIKEEKTSPPEEKLQSPSEIPQSVVEENFGDKNESESEEGVTGGAENGGGATENSECSTPNCVPGGTEESENKEGESSSPRVGGKVKQAKLIHQVEPEYPPLAKQSRIQGDVVLEAIIGIDGATHDIKVISGHTLLRQSAVNAVEQWKYEPATLNGEPTETTTTITIKYILK